MGLEMLIHEQPELGGNVPKAGYRDFEKQVRIV